MLRWGGWNRKPQRQPHPMGAAPAAREIEIARGELTTLRSFRAIDAADLVRWSRHSDPLLESYNMELRTVKEAIQWLEARHSWIDAELYAVESLTEQRVVGYIGLREISEGRCSSVLGISFDPAVMGRGYGTDALAAFLRYYFERRAFDVMLLDVAATNLRAQRCYEKCGFDIIGQRWKPFSGNSRLALKTPESRQYPELFRASGYGLSMLFYDMSLTRERWKERRAANTGTRLDATPEHVSFH